MAEARKAALVTGSSSGIGAAVARAFAEDGHDVLVNSSSSREAGETLAAEVGGAYAQADIADKAAVEAMVAAAVERFGRLDVVVNCAATTAVIPFDDLDAVTPEVWQRILGVNLIGTWNVIAAAVPHLREGEGGQVINVSSSSAERPMGSSIPYSVSKAGVNHMTRMLAKALGPEVRVNAVAPGMVDSPWTADWDAAREMVQEQVAMRRVGLPEDIAAACRMVARATYMTGAVVTVDGGLSLL
jgi:ketoreductase RED2